MWDNWIFSHPDLSLITLDVGRGQSENRSRNHVTRLVEVLMPHDERQLLRGLDYLANGKSSAAAAVLTEASRIGTFSTDIHLLAGAFELARGRNEEARMALEQCVKDEEHCGDKIRRIYPGLRILLRITPCVLLPVQPNDYGAGLMLAVALRNLGEHGAALEQVRELIARYGLNDELRLLGAQLLIQRGELDRAIQTLRGVQNMEEDAVALDQALLLAYALREREKYHDAARGLTKAVRGIRGVNQHLQARCKLLLAELYDRCELPFEALAISSEVPANAMPPVVARAQQQREDRWLTEVQHMSHAELERMSRVNTYMMYIPDSSEFDDPNKVSKFDIHRDPVAALKTREMSWFRRRADEQRISEYQAAVARGDSRRPPIENPLSGPGLQLKSRIRNAEQWWPGRSQALSAALSGGDGLEFGNASAVGHVLFDFCSMHEGSSLVLEGEFRSRLLSAFGGAVLLIGIVLYVLRLGIYGG
jgi:tetratricopeptide (TPR) repeat protein